MSLEETHHFGASEFIAVKSTSEDSRSWLAKSPVCHQLSQLNVAHVGVLHALHPFKVIRADQSGSFMFACISGEGEVLIDGRWMTVHAGEACCLPPFVANAIRAIEGSEPWTFCWVRYLEVQDQLPLISSKSPVKGPFASHVLRHAIEGLHGEVTSRASSPALNKLWIDLIHSYVLKFAQPSHGDKRLWRLWQEVEADLGRSWNVAQMAAIAAVSEEHLRRLSVKELGRSPMKHVIFLRMQKACLLLGTRKDKIETIAHEVGYDNPFTFSTTFKKWIGRRPSEYRQGSDPAESRTID
ncbi:MAG: AraC family transcriptional regulator [Roseibacillus sp.]